MLAQRAGAAATVAWNSIRHAAVDPFVLAEPRHINVALVRCIVFLDIGAALLDAAEDTDFACARAALELHGTTGGSTNLAALKICGSITRPLAQVGTTIICVFCGS